MSSKNDPRTQDLLAAGLVKVPNHTWVTPEELKIVEAMDKKNTVPRRPRTTKKGDKK